MTPETLALVSVPFVVAGVQIFLNRRFKMADDKRARDLKESDERRSQELKRADEARAEQLRKADQDRAAQTNILHEIKGAVTDHGVRIGALESRVGWHDRELGRLTNYRPEAGKS